MSERSRFIKVRLSDSEYRELCRRADSHGVTMSEHVRAAVTAVHESIDVAHELGRVRDHLQSVANQSRTNECRETLLLVRELAAARDARILSRVRAQLAAHESETARAGGGA